MQEVQLSSTVQPDLYIKKQLNIRHTLNYKKFFKVTQVRLFSEKKSGTSLRHLMGQRQCTKCVNCPKGKVSFYAIEKVYDSLKNQNYFSKQ